MFAAFACCVSCTSQNLAVPTKVLPIVLKVNVLMVQVPSEIHPLETRATGQAVTVFTNFMASFIIGQFFNSMLCRMQAKPFPPVPLFHAVAGRSYTIHRASPSKFRRTVLSGCSYIAVVLWAF